MKVNLSFTYSLPHFFLSPSLSLLYQTCSLVPITISISIFPPLCPVASITTSLTPFISLSHTSFLLLREPYPLTVFPPSLHMGKIYPFPRLLVLLEVFDHLRFRASAKHAVYDFIFARTILILRSTREESILGARGFNGLSELLDPN
jgi:hypothetical protein